VSDALPVAHPWFRAEDAGQGISRLWEPHIDELLESNVWHVPGRDADLVVDFANGIGPLRPSVDVLTSGRAVIAVATHGHFDHVGGLREFDDRRVHRDDVEMTRSPYPMRLRRQDFPEDAEEMFEYYGYPVPETIVRALPSAGFDVEGWVAPGAEPTMLLDEGDVIDLGDRRFTVLHTPGHTDGSACLLEEATGTLFGGDAVYVDAKLSWDDAEAMTRSLERLRDLAPEVHRVHAGHGRSFDAEELVTTCEDWLRQVAQT
jgi:glyoxylase-like metal-dependent hydrolase (beta-lactamase superfamily II)